MKALRKIRNILSKDPATREMAIKSASAMALRLGGLLVNYVFLLYVTRTYGSASWGVFTLGFTILQMSATIGTLGFNMSYVKLFASDAYDRRRLAMQVLEVVVPFNLLITLAVYFGASFIASNLKDGNMPVEYVEYMALAILPFALSLVNAGIYRGLKQIARFTFYDSFGRFLLGMLGVMVASLFIEGESAIILGFCGGLMVVVVLSFTGLASQRHLWKREGQGQERLENGPLTGMSVDMLWGVLTNRGFYWLSTLIMGAYLAKEDIGVFDTCIRLGQLSTVVLFAVTSISAPQFAENTSPEKRQELLKVVRRSAKSIFWLSMPIGIVLMLGSTLFLGVIGKDFERGADILIYIIIGEMFHNTTGSVGMFMQMTGLHREYRNVILFTLALHVALCLLVVPTYGMLGAAIIYGLTRGLKNLLSAWIAYRKTGINSLYIPFIST